MRLIAYTRGSTIAQEITPAAQYERISAYCAVYEHTLVGPPYTDRLSGKTVADRPGLLRALDAVRYQDGLIVAKLDRLTRNVADLAQLLETHLKDKALVSVAEQIDTRGAAGRMVMNILVSVAQWEREAIGERTSAALQHLRESGVPMGAAPYGYQWRRTSAGGLYHDPETGRGILEPHPAEQETIARANVLRAEGRTIAEVAAALGAEGRRPRSGKGWDLTRLGVILKHGQGGITRRKYGVKPRR